MEGGNASPKSDPLGIEIAVSHRGSPTVWEWTNASKALTDQIDCYPTGQQAKWLDNKLEYWNRPVWSKS